MGDRGNIVFEMPPVSGSPKSRLFLYTHWGGSDLPETLQKALGDPKAKTRWSDEAYLARITFNHLQGYDRGETGFGIATYPPDNEHPYLVVDCEHLTVAIEQVGGMFSDHPLAGRLWTFGEFLSEPLSTFQSF